MSSFRSCFLFRIIFIVFGSSPFTATSTFLIRECFTILRAGWIRIIPSLNLAPIMAKSTDFLCSAFIEDLGGVGAKSRNLDCQLEARSCFTGSRLLIDLRGFNNFPSESFRSNGVPSKASPSGLIPNLGVY